MGEHGQKRILIVEDEEQIAKLLTVQLEAAGYEAHAEARGRAALRYAAEHDPDLVILDLKLPDIGGYEVCKELRSLYHSWVMPVLMVTAMDAPIDQMRGFAHGADAYLTKPFEMRDLLEAVSQLLGESSAQARAPA